ncbi:putative metalloprotease CJM1_0395 family protein [Roseospira visakhapatnamensis]|uniref:SprA family protein n=1 Tax=Roseospira visakhapatnamensis TaxID=390880 RepID=A0A7W6RBG2_9PROT|nr:putative metalloprotease CJM1_0395 family protein [Roseospira visakhapatnamensis]MBB4265350.1 hypothetical protein [Roseospira visakhapatnamensis]
MLIAPLDVQTTYVVRERGPAGVNPASLRSGRDPGQGDLAAVRRAASATLSQTTGRGVEIAGRSPSLSTGIIGTLGEIGGASLNRLDPLTGEPIEVDPLTGEPMPADPLSALLSGDQAGGGAGTASDTGDGAGGDGGATAVGSPTDLTPEELAEVRRLQAIDRQVRAHEAAHKAAGAGVTGPATFTYVTGPDGRQYAVAGEVAITVNASPANPEQAVEQLEQVKRAALAPADPSPADRAAAAAADAALTQAEAEVRVQNRAEARDQAQRRAERQGAEAAAGLTESPPPLFGAPETSVLGEIVSAGAAQAFATNPVATAPDGGRPGSNGPGSGDRGANGPNPSGADSAGAVGGPTTGRVAPAVSGDAGAGRGDADGSAGGTVGSTESLGDAIASLTGGDDARRAVEDPAIAVSSPFAAAAAAYGQAGSLIGGAPTPFGDPAGVIEPRTVFSLVA